MGSALNLVDHFATELQDHTWREACKCIGGQLHDLETGAVPSVRNLLRSRRRLGPVAIRQTRNRCSTAYTTGQDEDKENPRAAASSHSTYRMVTSSSALVG